MKYSVLTLSLMLLFGLGAVQAQEMVTVGQVTMVGDDKPSLTSDKKEKLSMSISRRAFTEAVFLPPATKVKVVSRQTYVKQETVGPQANLVKRSFTAALVEILDGDHKGSKGWVVLEVSDGGRADRFFAPVTGIAPSTTSVSSSQVDPNMPDLQVGVYANTNANVAGKQIYGVSVVNNGGSEAKGSFDVVVKVGDKVVKTERVRNLRSGGAHSFTFEVSDTHVRNHAPVVITVDAANGIKEGNETNNAKTTTL